MAQETVISGHQIRAMSNEEFRDLLKRKIIDCELVKCDICGTLTPIVYVRPPRDSSLLSVGRFVDRDGYYRDTPVDPRRDFNANGMITGSQQGSGKTVLLYHHAGYQWADAFHHRNRICRSRYGMKTVVLRSKPEAYEFLSFLDVGAPINLIIPEKCEFNFNHPLLHITYHPLENFKYIFESFKVDMINVLGMGTFIEDLGLQYSCAWWVRFFKEYISWKMAHQTRRICLFIDEIGDLIPSRGQSKGEGHISAGNRIRDKLDSVRKSNTKLVCTTHTETDISKRFRVQFRYFFIKKSAPSSLNNEIWSYGRKIAGMDEKEVFVTDWFGKVIRPSPAFVLTRSNFNVQVKSPWTDEEIMDATGTQDSLRAHFASIMYWLREPGPSIPRPVSFSILAKMAGWGNKSRPAEFLSRMPKERVDKILPKPEWQLEEKGEEKESGDEQPVFP